jgi:hypothetical protein
MTLPLWPLGAIVGISRTGQHTDAELSGIFLALMIHAGGWLAQGGG